MLRKVFKFLFVAEVIVLGVPVTLFALFGLMVLVSTYARGAAVNPDFVPSAFAALLSCVGLFGFWGLSGLYLSGGGRALRNSPIWLLIPTAIGVAMTSLVFVMPSNSPFKPLGMIGAFGIPLLLPMLHMAIGTMAEGG